MSSRRKVVPVEAEPAWKRIERAYNEGLVHGWKPDPAHRAKFLAESRTPYFEAAAPDVMDDAPRDTFLYRAVFECLKAHRPSGWKWKPQYQKAGTCVGQGFKLGADTCMSIGWLLKQRQFLGRAAVASVYAGSRVEVGKNPGSWDGSTGSWAAEWMTKFGVALQKDLSLEEDSLDPDEKMARSWAASRQGVPQEFEEVARRRPVKNASLVTRARAAGLSIQSGYPIGLCTQLIPTGRRDSRGFSPMRRTGGHCTLLWAVRWDPFGLLYQNSWSEEWGEGPVWPDDQPPGSVWINEDQADQALGENDSYVLGDTEEGFPKRDLSYFML